MAKRRAFMTPICQPTTGSERLTPLVTPAPQGRRSSAIGHALHCNIGTAGCARRRPAARSAPLRAHPHESRGRKASGLPPGTATRERQRGRQTGPAAALPGARCGPGPSPGRAIHPAVRTVRRTVPETCCHAARALGPRAPSTLLHAPPCPPPPARRPPRLRPQKPGCSAASRVCPGVLMFVTFGPDDMALFSCRPSAKTSRKPWMKQFPVIEITRRKSLRTGIAKTPGKLRQRPAASSRAPGGR